MTRHSPPAGTRTRDPAAALTPEERALAERIARATPRHAPSAALDARILALAQAMTLPDAPVAPVATMPPTTRTPPLRARGARRRWPAAFGIAATLALAVGLAWQLRPLDDMRDTASETATAAVAVADQATAAGAAPAVAAHARADAGDTASMTATATPPTQDAAAGRDAAAIADDDAAAPGIAAPAAVTATAVPAPADMAPSPPVAAPPSFAPPSPAAPPPPVSAAKPQLLPQRAGLPPPASTAQAFSAAPATGTLQDRDAQAAAAGRERRADAANAADAASPRAAAKNVAVPPSPAPRAGTPAEEVDRVFADQPLDAEPPASADSPQVQQAWLKRVRELLAQGKREIARDSLREYQRRYPQAPLPDDLRALLE